MLEVIRPEWSGRLQQVSLDSPGGGLDAFVVSSPANLRYLTGFDGTSGLLVRSREGACLLVDGRYAAAVRAAQASGRVADVDLVVVAGGYPAALGAALRARHAGRVGFEAAHVTVALLERWRAQAKDAHWVATEGAVERLRLIKDRTEIALLRRAGRLLSAVAGELRHIVRGGRTEREVARAIDLLIDRAGFSGPAFPTIVASGPHSAQPHARPTGRRLTAGDLVVLDFGGVLDGYCVDLTRMASIGQPPAEGQALFDAVFEAQRQAISAIRPGVAASDVDQAARALLESRGYGAAFVHATGHGLGLEVHEAPRIGKPGDEAPEVLAAGMVFTVEPGAYVEGVAGVRLEDDVMVVEGGVESLTDAPRELLIA